MTFHSVRIAAFFFKVFLHKIMLFFKERQYLLFIWRLKMPFKIETFLRCWHFLF